MKGSTGLYFVDRVGGGVLCALLSCFSAGRGRPPAPRDAIRRVLLVDLFEMGAAVMAAPSVLFLKQTLPDAEIFCLTCASTSVAWDALQLLEKDHVLRIDDKSPAAFVLSGLKQIWKLGKARVDLVIDFNLFFRISAVLSGLVRAPFKAGFSNPGVRGLYRGRIHNVRCVFNQNAHIARNFLALAKTAVLRKNDEPNYKGSLSTDELILPRYSSDPAERAQVERMVGDTFPARTQGHPLLVVSADVGPNLSMRNYPVPSFAACLKELLARDATLHVALVGTASDQASASGILSLVDDPRCASLCGKTSFSGLLALLEISRAVLCNDNGIAHFAALTRTPVVALFSTDSPMMYGPLGACTIAYANYHCSPCISAFNHKRSVCTDNQCLQAIDPGTVAAYVEHALAGLVRTRTVNESAAYV